LRHKLVNTQESELEVGRLLKATFGEENVKVHPKVNMKQPDFRVKVNDEYVYVEVRAIKDIASDQTKFSRIDDISNNLREIAPEGIVGFELEPAGRNRVLDRIAQKISEECKQLPDGEQNVLIVKGEGFSILPDKIIGAIVERILQINRTTMNVKTKIISHFRTEKEAREALEKISAIIAYRDVCQHEKLRGAFRNNERNAKIPLTKNTFSKFSSLMCKYCAY